ncbi:32698_t:CDS:2 [Gigaspora margarita]|uniref:32698_t:CDS:1 n=1 Tax=Gigaspora margarita TaxID=4874 RepID=A0ABM8VXY3_GIGMA|nr:32698_t:CDS:2 [Gigaspora margarita]
MSHVNFDIAQKLPRKNGKNAKGFEDRIRIIFKNICYVAEVALPLDVNHMNESSS